MSDFWSQFVPNNTAAQADTGLYAITDQQILTVEGPDSAKFMQGQFTCNLNEVTSTSFRRGACCNPKGRMITSFSLAQGAENLYHLSMDKDLAEKAQSHLKKYMVFFKTEMRTSQWVQVGIRGSQASSIIESTFGGVPSEDFAQLVIDQGIILKLPFNAGFELWIKPDQAESTVTALNQQCPLLTEGSWSQIRIAFGLGHVTAASQEELIPQMMNLAQTGGISFNKGCYTGQEIVARMQYLGKLKRHMYRIALTASQNPSAFAAIQAEGKSSPVGHVINAAQTANDRFEALVVLEDKYLDNLTDLHIDQSTEIELLDLPYDVAPPAGDE